MTEDSCELFERRTGVQLNLKSDVFPMLSCCLSFNKVHKSSTSHVAVVSFDTGELV